MPYIEVSLPVQAAAEDIYYILKEMDKYPQFMNDLESVTVLERQGNYTITNWVSRVDGRVIRWKEKDIFDDENMHIMYQQIEGDLSRMQGEWILTPLENGTEIKLTVDFEFGIPMIAGLLNPILKKKVRINSENMLQAIRQRLEQSAHF